MGGEIILCRIIALKILQNRIDEYALKKWGHENNIAVWLTT